MKIIAADIGVMPKSLFDAMPKVTVTYGDGTTEELFSYYPDELIFSPTDFIGLTRSEAMEVRHRKDVAYLQS